LNSRPFGPQPNALPDCATPRGRSSVRQSGRPESNRRWELGRLQCYQLHHARLRLDYRFASRQAVRARIGDKDGGTVIETGAIYKTWAEGLAGGKLNDQDELPFLQLLLIANEADSKSYGAGPPRALQRAIAPLAAAIARMRSAEPRLSPAASVAAPGARTRAHAGSGGSPRPAGAPRRRRTPLRGPAAIAPRTPRRAAGSSRRCRRRRGT
jgi:hypothetical protein